MEFFSFIDDPSFCIPSAIELLSGFARIKPSIEELKRQRRTDILMLLIRKCAAVVQDTPEQATNLDLFLQCLPQELCVVFFRLLSDKRPELADLPDRLNSFERVQKAILSNI